MKITRVFIIIGLISLISLACAIPGLSKESATATAVPTITSVPTQPPPPTATPNEQVIPEQSSTTQVEPPITQDINQDISIINDNSYSIDSYNYIVGILQNNTENTIEYIDISVLIYDENNSLIATESIYPFLDKVGPGETSPFSISSDSWTNGDTYDFLIEDYDIADEPPEEGMVILSHSVYSDDYALYLVGEVQNDSDVPMSFVKVTGTIYSADGTLLNANYMYTTISNIAPGNKSPYKIWFSDNWQDTDNYEVFVRGYHDEYSIAQPVQVINYELTSDDYSCTVTGNVQNNGTEELTYATVVVVFYDSSNTAIDTEWNFSANDSLPVGSSSPFSITTYSCQNFDHIEVYAGN